MTDYLEFLHSKIEVAPVFGFDVDPGKLHPNLKPHQIWKRPTCLT